MRPRKGSIFRRSGNRFAAENATTKGKHFPAKWKPVRRRKCDHEGKAFSGEVGTGSPQKMRPRRESIFRRSGNRFAAENATTKGKHFPAKWEPVRRRKCDHEGKAFSGEVGTGSPQKMRPRRESIFRRSGNRFAAENATTKGKHFPAKWKPVRRRKCDHERITGANSDSTGREFARAMRSGARMSTLDAMATRPSDAGNAQLVADFLRGASFETTRLTAADLAALKDLGGGVSVYVSAIPSRPADEQIAVAAVLQAHSVEPILHIAVREFASAQTLGAQLTRLAEQASVRRALIIAGDRAEPAGPFRAAIELIESGLLQDCGILDIGIADYPDGHPRIAPLDLDRARAAKIEAPSQTG